MYREEEYLLLSGIQHFAFCRRQWALIHIEQQWSDNFQTTSGELFHERAHDETLVEKRGDILTVRGLRIASTQLGVTGQCDVVEFHRSDEGIEIQKYDGKWEMCPIEYKRGMPKEGDEDRLQLCAQAICLEEHFATEISVGYLFYGENKRRTEVQFTPELRKLVQSMCDEMHQMFRRGYTPKVKPKRGCTSCSLRELCLPKLSKYENVTDYIANAIGEETVEKEGM